ncbi:non-ribosomal peptide synthetase [Myxococcus stipitatus]|uniref:non-ribosomal peptide synthetase n=1 Tax=Myxococcus stipitatus TaxID=83455 RepID=UPI0030D4BF1E
MFQEQVQRAPEALALVDGARRLTYRELNARANRLARHLVKLGVRPRALVGICLERSVESVVGCLAILKAGGAYVPIDHRYPAERIRFILRDSAVRLVLTTRELVPSLPGPTCVCVDDEHLTDTYEDTDLATAPQPSFSAYVMYTSGTTGEPKGAEIPQSGIVRLVRHSTYLELDESITVLHHSTCSFDAATFEIWAALLNGGRLVIHRPALELDSLGALLRDQGITTLLLTTSVFHLVAEHKPEALGPLRHVVTGGDVLRVREVKAVLDLHPHLLIINGYGPTENTTFTCCFPITRQTPLEETIPIGRPIGGTNVFLLDAQLRPVRPGEVGQLFTNGLGLANGYLHQPELTRRHFIDSPFPESGPVLYATGDLVREGPDGQLHFVGRVDSQLKIRGFRVEPGEIEHALNLWPEVAESVVLAETLEPGGEKQLVAYVKRRSVDVPLDAAALKQDLAERLPHYMVPSRLHVLDAFPLTHNGKLDRARLRRETPPEPTPGTPPEPRAAGCAQVVLDVWRQRLGAPGLQATASVFDHGASSLTVMVVQSELNARLKCLVDPALLARAHTPLEWADVYQRHHSAPSGA